MDLETSLLQFIVSLAVSNLGTSEKAYIMGIIYKRTNKSFVSDIFASGCISIFLKF